MLVSFCPCDVQTQISRLKVISRREIGIGREILL